MSEQKGRIDATDWSTLIIMDAGRYDVFAEIAPGIDGLDTEHTLINVGNGDCGFTANWMASTFDGEYDAKFFHGGQPIYSMEGGMTWDERQHFDVPVHYTDYEWDTKVGTCWPATVNEIVQAYSDPGEQKVVRYLCPHPPFPDMVDLTRGRGNRTRQVAKAVRAGDVTVEDVRAAYTDFYRTGLRAAAKLAEWSDGATVITADHGECLGDCGQWFHGPVGEGGHDPHDHLVLVPWLVVE